jgi:hypothetical protein
LSTSTYVFSRRPFISSRSVHAPVPAGGTSAAQRREDRLRLGGRPDLSQRERALRATVGVLALEKLEHDLLGLARLAPAEEPERLRHGHLDRGLERDVHGLRQPLRLLLLAGLPDDLQRGHLEGRRGGGVLDHALEDPDALELALEEHEGAADREPPPGRRLLGLRLEDGDRLGLPLPQPLGERPEAGHARVLRLREGRLDGPADARLVDVVPRGGPQPAHRSHEHDREDEEGRATHGVSGGVRRES